MMGETEIRACLGPVETVGGQLICLEEVDSTNTYAKRLAAEGAADGTVVLAAHQTAGRGRMDRSFQSPRDKGIYLTALLRPSLPPERLLPVTALAGVAVCDAVEEVCGLRPGLKWPNDPVLHGKKLCGILTELTMDPDTGGLALVLGIGLNVEQTASDFSPEVAETATSLAMELGEPVSLSAVAAALIRALDRLYATLRGGDLAAYLAAYRRDCVNLGKTVQLIASDGSRETVEAVDVDAQFGLVVRSADGGERTIRSGEVSVRGMYGYAD